MLLSPLQAQIAAIIDSGIKFSDIFEEPAAKVAATEACPDGFTSINAGQAGGNRECLKLRVRPNSEVAQPRPCGAACVGRLTTQFRQV